MRRNSLQAKEKLNVASTHLKGKSIHHDIVRNNTQRMNLSHENCSWNFVEFDTLVKVCDDIP